MTGSDLVLTPPRVRKVLPCIGSLSQTTGPARSATARTSGGNSPSMRSAPIRTMKVSLPGTPAGLSLRASSTASSGAVVGPIFTPIGLRTDPASSTCAPSGARVRSPTQPKSGEEPELDLAVFAPERAPLEGVPRETVIDTTVEHMLATGYEHHWNIPTDWQEYLAADLKPIYTRWADEIDAEFTPPPELLASSRLHPRMVEWMRAYYDNCRSRFGRPARAQTRSVGEEVARAQAVLTTAQVWTPRQDALALAAHVTGTTVEGLGLDAPLPGDKAETFWSLVRRRTDRVPLEYLTGRARLFDLEFHVGEGVFIPRVHSEAMIEDALARCTAERPRAVDLCTGSGAIALAVARLRPGATVTGVDISATAVRCAEGNAERLREQIPGTVEFVEGDAADPQLLAELDGGVDLVTANPPYVPHSLQIPPEWAVYQPANAIYSGWDGLDLTRAVAATAARLLRRGGVLAIEHYDAVVDDVVDILRSAGFTSVTSRTDHDGFPRYVIAQRPEA